MCQEELYTCGNSTETREDALSGSYHRLQLLRHALTGVLNQCPIRMSHLDFRRATLQAPLLQHLTFPTAISSNFIVHGRVAVLSNAQESVIADEPSYYLILAF